MDWTSLRTDLVSAKADFILPPTIKLPVLPDAFLKFQERVKDPSAEIEELGAIISNDAGLCAELLRWSNSAKSFSKTQVTSASRAITKLGIRTTSLILTTASLMQVMKTTASKLIHFKSFWNTNLERSILAKEIAKILSADGDIAFTACMLQDFLLPTITNELYDHYLEFSDYREEHATLSEFERNQFGWDHGMAAAHVMRSWQFPDELVCCVALHHKGVEILDHPELRNTSAAAVSIASLMPEALRQIDDGLDQLIQLQSDWPEFDLMSIAENVDETFQETTGTENRFSLLRACQKAMREAESH